MAVDRERILRTIQTYVDTVASGTSDEVLALYAEGATVEDPVGTPPLTDRAAIKAFYATLDGLDKKARLLFTRIAGDGAAFGFELTTTFGDTAITLSPVDVMTFDDDGRITSMRAFWSGEDEPIRLA